MKTSKKWLVLLCTLWPALCIPQSLCTINGTITNAQTGEFLIGANVMLTSFGQGTTTNNYGFYSLTIPAQDSIGIVFSYLGYQEQIKKVYLQSNVKLNVELEPHSHTLSEVIVSAEEGDINLKRTMMGVVDIPISKISELPVILGEPDVLKLIQLLPGVQAGNEGTTGYFVRGGNVDQNLVQLDEATIYNPNHLVGLVSTFNASAINNVSLIKGGFPAQYGGRLSSILDIKLREGNKKRFSGEGAIGLIASKLSLEGPIKKDTSSFIVSARRTYFDFLIKPFLPKKIKTNYIFYDLNAKVNHALGENDRIYLSGFLSKDDAFYSQDGIEYNLLIDNKAATFRWNHIFGPRLFANTSLIYNSFDQDVSALQNNAFSEVLSGIRDLNAKIELQYFPGPRQNILFGAHFTDHTFKSSGDSQAFSTTLQNPGIARDSIPVKKFDELAVYINDDIKISDRFSTSIGLRIPCFYADEARYCRVEPRLALRYGINQSTSIKAAYTMMNQFVHLIPSSAAAIPTDIWIPSTKQTRPQASQQYSLGLFKNFKNNRLESSVEVYYKTMDDQILFREGNQFIRSLDVDDLLVYGKGWSYGAEFFVQKQAGRFTGWASYTLSWSYQKFADLNFGKKFPFRYDRRHNLALVASCQLSDKWTLSGTFVFSTGNAYTVPVGRSPIINGGTLFEGNYYIYEERNNTRLNPFHRLNISAIYKKQRKLFGKKYDSQLVFSIYNVYSRQNPYFVYFDINPITEKPRATQVSLLPILPSVSFNFKF